MKIVVAGIMALAATAVSFPAAAKDIKIGVVNLSLCCAYFVGMDQAIKDEAKVFPNVSVI
jgi:ribose transport system substrate-binding protein